MREPGFMKTRTREGNFERLTREPPPIITNLSPHPAATPPPKVRTPAAIAAMARARFVIYPPLESLPPVYARVRGGSSRISISDRSGQSIDSFPPRFPQLGHLQVLLIRVESVGVETEVGGHAHSHRPGSVLQEAGEVRWGELLPPLPPTARKIDPVERQGPFLRPSNEDRLAISAPGDEKISGLRPHDRAGASLSVGPVDQVQSLEGRARDLEAVGRHEGGTHSLFGERPRRTAGEVLNVGTGRLPLFLRSDEDPPAIREERRPVILKRGAAARKVPRLAGSRRQQRQVRRRRRPSDQCPFLVRGQRQRLALPQHLGVRAVGLSQIGHETPRSR